jgi:hypothetical protein
MKNKDIAKVSTTKRIIEIQNDIKKRLGVYSKQELEKLTQTFKAREDLRAKGLEDFKKKLAQDYDPKTLPKIWKDPIGWFVKRRLIASISTRLLINMERVNGEHETFFINLDLNSFIWEKNTYMVDINTRYYSVQGKCFCLDYHEQYTLPIKRAIPIKDIRNQITNAYPQISFASDPNLLKLFVESDVIKKILQGSAIEDMFNLFKILMFVNLIIGFITLMVVIFK